MTSTSCGWDTTDELRGVLEGIRRRTLAVYRADPRRLTQDSHGELSRAEGGYFDRQVVELLQNAIDELGGEWGGRVELVVDGQFLYCASNGKPFSAGGITAVTGEYEGVKDAKHIGQFGLGFKSVRGLGDEVSVFSRTVSFGFSVIETLGLLESESILKPPESLPVESAPLLRLPFPRDFASAAKSDACLNSLGTWATTVIRVLLRDQRAVESATDQILELDTRLLLFSPRLERLRTRVNGETADSAVERDGELGVLAHDDELSTWRVFTSSGFEPSPAAAERAGFFANRLSRDITWAVEWPLKSHKNGEIWLYFPTDWTMSVAGCLNAAWKSDDSRKGLTNDIYNRELMSAAARLVVESLPELAKSDDPGAILDLFPEAAPNDSLTSRVWASTIDLVAKLPSIPSSSGRPATAPGLRLPPEDLPPDVLELWQRLDLEDESWAHQSCYSTRHRRRVLAHMNARPAPAVTGWLTQLATREPTPDRSINVLALARSLLDERDGTTLFTPADLADARVLLAADETTLLPLDPHKAFIHDDESAARTSRIHPDISRTSQAVLDLDAFGIRSNDSLRALLELADVAGGRPSDLNWERFWKHAAEVTPAELCRVADDHLGGQVWARTMSGEFQPPWLALTFGTVVHSDGDSPSVTVDHDFHSATIEHLEALGFRSTPVRVAAFGIDEPVVREWIHDSQQEFLRSARHYRTGGRAQSVDYLRVARGAAELMPGPLQVLQGLGIEERCRYTAELISRCPSPPRWSVRHTTPGAYPPLAMSRAVATYIHKFGMMDSSLGPIELDRCVGGELATLGDILPVVDLSPAQCLEYEVAAKWSLVTGLLLDDVFGRHLADDRPDLAVRLAEAAAAGGARVPSTLPAVDESGWGLFPTETVTVMTEASSAFRAATGGPALVVSNQNVATGLVGWGAIDGDLIARDGIGIEADECQDERPMADRFPWLSGEPLESARRLRVIGCASVRKVARGDPSSLAVDVTTSLADDDQWFFVDSPEVDDTQLTRSLMQDIGRGDLAALAAQQLQEWRNQFSAEQFSRARDADTDEERLAILLKDEQMATLLGPDIVDAMEQMGVEPRSEALAAALLALHGDAAGRVVASVLRSQMQTPSHFTGGFRARQFVEDLGFSRRFAGQSKRETPNQEVFGGPPRLDPLHSFQKPVVEEAAESVRSGSRALVWLPTGAGKTRVAVEALVRVIKPLPSYSFIWVAERKELCEQAIGAIKHVWSAIGPDRDLTVSRLWEGRRPSEPSGTHCVVTTIQTLHERLGDPQFSWLLDAECIVVDEAHRSISNSYGPLISGAVERGTAILGLSATPFRSDDRDTKRLVGLYGEYLIRSSELGEDPVAVLQEREILSTVDHREVDGADLELTDEELGYLETFEVPSPALEERLSGDAGRNRRLKELVLAMDSEWQVLVFATSVRHAEKLGAALNACGRSSRVISGSTDDYARKSMVDEYNTGQVRVLLNYGVFTEGFDAPKTRAVVIARPTYSPNLYQQMIGRGLRGVAQGGTAECQIWDVVDNLRRFNRSLAFTDFTSAWSQP